MNVIKATLRTAVVTFQLEEADAQSMFKSLAYIQEVFGEQRCGLCKCDLLRFNHRQADGNDFYEMECTHCRAKLSFGTTKVDRRLFPIRKLMPNGKPSWKEGSYGEHNGWTKFRGDQQ